MAFELDYRDRQTGKTTDLIEWARDTERDGNPMRYLIVPTARDVQDVQRQAEVRYDGQPGPHLGGMRFPLFWDEATHIRGMARSVEFAIDDLDAIVRDVLFRYLPGPVVKASWSYDSRRPN